MRKAWITFKMRIGSTLKNSRATTIVYSVELGLISFIVLCQWTCTLVLSPFVNFVCSTARIVGLISTKCAAMLLSGISFENTWWQRQNQNGKKIVQHTFKMSAINVPFPGPSSIILRGISLRDFWYCSKSQIATSCSQDSLLVHYRSKLLSRIQPIPLRTFAQPLDLW